MVIAADSSVAGYLAPIGAQPADDAALDLLFQPAIVGITGLAGTMVRRRGQAVPGAQPARDATWCAFSVATTTADTNPTIVHDGSAESGAGVSYDLRSELLEISASFFGPAAVGTAKTLRDGLGISQNREALRAAGIAYVALDRITFLADPQNGQVIRRADVVFRARRIVSRTYPIRNIASVDGVVIADSGGPTGDRVVQSPFQTET